MSNNESFIDEVSDEVRRDRLYATIKRWGWVAVVLVVLIVGGAAFSEWRKAQARAEAEALGDRMMAGLEANDAQALAAIETEGDAGVIATLLAAAELQESGDSGAAVALLEEAAADQTVPPLYRDLAGLKALMMPRDDLAPADRRQRLEALASPGAPFRLLAEEQIALSLLAEGDAEAAVSRLQSIVEDAAVTRGLRRRAGDLIVALDTGAAEAEAAAEAAAEADAEAPAETEAEPAAE